MELGPSKISDALLLFTLCTKDLPCFKPVVG